MKRWINLFSGVMVLFQFMPTNAIAGNESGGGDGYAAEFVLTAKTALELAKKLDPSDLLPVNIDTLTGAIANTSVHSEEKLVFEGNEVDAINYPDKKLIKISRVRWTDLRTESQTFPRFYLVIHEYLGIMGIDDSQYSVSQRLINSISPSKFSTTQWWHPMNPTNEIVPHVELPGVGCSNGAWTLNFDINKPTETQSQKLRCDGREWKIVANKTERYGASTSGIKGTYHSFEVKVFDGQNNLLGSGIYSPEWGRCLLSSDVHCSQSGEFKIDSVTFNFWMSRR
jgi:hypothetical protein